MESIESYNNIALRPLSGLHLQSHGQGQRNKMAKISSADSLLSMIRNIASSKISISSPSSPQLSDNGDIASSGYPTPLSTPDTPNGSFISLHHPTKDKSKTGSQIMVSVLNPLNPKKSTEGQDKPSSDSQSSSEGPPTITLEVPSFNYGKCLSPIREMPSPLPTPCPSPLPTPNMTRQQMTAEDHSVVSDCSSSISYGSSVSRCSNARRNMNKAKTVPQEIHKKEYKSKVNSVSNDSYSFDSGEGTFDTQDYCDGGASDFSEISIPIPSFRSSSSSSIDVSLSKSPTTQNPSTNIPIIMTSIYDSAENLCKPVQHIEPKPSTRNKRLVKQRHIPPNIIIPQVSISFDDSTEISTPLSSNSSSSSSPAISPSGKIKKRPPPLVIPDSNFFNFKDDVQSAPVEIVKSAVTHIFDESSEDSKQTKATSLDKNITLFKQKSFEEDLQNIDSPPTMDNQKLLNDDSNSDEKSPFLGKNKLMMIIFNLY